jgi:hypothetical protein
MTMPVDEKTSVKMKFVGHFKGAIKTVNLPIPLIANSQKLEQELTFVRTAKSGPAFCDVPMEWAGALLAVGGNFQAAEKITPQLQAAIEVAQEETDERMKKQAIENDLMVDA